MIWENAERTELVASGLVVRSYDPKTGAELWSLGMGGGRVSCYNAETGEIAYEKTPLPQSKSFWSSPWAYNDEVFLLDDTGKTYVLKAGQDFELLRTNTIGDRFWATAAMTDGSLILRGVDYVYCVETL